jgi:D-arginine dehydrogenase
MLLGGPGEEAEAEADIDTMALTPISPEEARAQVPILDPANLTRAGFTTRPGISTPTAWCSISQGRSGPTGRDVRTGNRSRRSRATAARGSVTVADGTHSARIILNAAGAWADGIAEQAGVAPLGLTAAAPVHRAHAGARRA